MHFILFASVWMLAAGPSSSVSGQSRTFQFENRCSETIWPGAQGNPLPKEGGWVMAPGSQMSLVLPGHASAVRFWGRTDCQQQQNGLFRCLTGSCDQTTFQCRGAGGVAPATLAEFTLGGEMGPDYYDLSLVDGHNLDMKIEPLNGLSTGLGGKYDCGSPVARFNSSQCPPELRLVADNGRVACCSLCAAVYNRRLRNSGGMVGSLLSSIYNNADQRDLVCCACGGHAKGCSDPTSKYCCSQFETGTHGGVCRVADWPKPSTFTKDGLTYDAIFKRQAPDAYSWQFDDMKSTYQCRQADYKITFCPDNDPSPSGILPIDPPSRPIDGSFLATTSLAGNSSSGLYPIGSGGAGAGAGVGAGSGGAGAGSGGAGAGAGTNTGANIGAGSGSGSGSGTGAGIGAGSGSGSGTGTGTNAGANTGPGTGTGANTGPGAGSGSGSAGDFDPSCPCASKKKNLMAAVNNGIF